MRILTIDQSMASCAFLVLDNGEPIFKEVLKTARIKANNPDREIKDYITVFNHATEQMDYLSTNILLAAKSFNVDHVITEALSFGSVGDATRDLAGLFHCIQLTLLRGGFSMEQVLEVAPTAVKAWAWRNLPEEEQYSTVDFKKNGDPNKVKMDKDNMIKVCNRLCPGLLDGYTKSGRKGGATDIADAYLIGRYGIDKLSGNIPSSR